MLTSDASNRGWWQRYSNVRIYGLPRGINVLLQAAVIAFFVSGCSTPEQMPPQQVQRDEDYRLSVNDLLDFRIFQEPEFDAVIRVSGDGTAIFPMIGQVQVAGKTIGETTELLRNRYMSGYLTNPQVNLTVRTYALKTFTILGQVQRPGTYQIEGGEPVSLLQAVGMAGGYTRIANPSKVIVKRREGGVENVYQFNAKKMANSGADSSFRVMPGDVITVAESIF
ncbi:MAG TPA: polysaccharide biosynthesis/export family protein [Terrimicrobiaceae bacterium]